MLHIAKSLSTIVIDWNRPQRSEIFPDMGRSQRRIALPAKFNDTSVTPYVKLLVEELGS
jgi:hypothetical protein